jgi:hypothetical protein
VKLIFKKRFSLKDTKSFAIKSGDKNKIHIDKNVEKFTNYKKPIIHGCYIIQEIIYKIKKKKFFEKYLINNLQIFFKEPIFVNEKISVYLLKTKNNLIKLGVFSGIIEKIIINIEIKKNKKNQDLVFENISKIKFFKVLKNISKFVGNFQKKNNIISQIEIVKNEKNSKLKKIKKINKILFELTLENKNLKTSTKFLSPSLNYFDKKVNLDKKLKDIEILSKEKKILIIGGSSGLGKILTEFLYRKKLDVTFTFNNNIIGTKKFCKKYKKLKCFQFNERIFKRNNIKQKLKTFNYIYFFPTPKIFEITDDYFKTKNLLKFIDVYSMFLKNIIDCLAADKKYKIFVPSSEIVNSKQTNFFNYKMGKIIQENLCQFINRKSKNIMIHNPRLGIHYTRKTFHLMNNNFNFNNFLNTAIKILK